MAFLDISRTPPNLSFVDTVTPYYDDGDTFEVKLWYGTERPLPPRLTSCVQQPDRWVAIPITFTFAVQTQLAAPFSLRPNFAWLPTLGLLTEAFSCQPKLAFTSLKPGYVTRWDGYYLVKSITPKNPTGKVDSSITMYVVHDGPYDTITAVSGSTVCGGSRDKNTTDDLIVPLTGSAC